MANQPTRRAFLSGMTATIVSLPYPAHAQSPAAARAITAAPAQHRFRQASETAVLAYDGMVPGPLLRVKRGEPFRLTLENRLVQPTTLHWHGVRLPNPMDGVAGLTQEAVRPGASFDVRFSPKDAGTFWYRPLVPALAAEQTERGLYGLLVVDEDKVPAFDQDLALVLDDVAIDDDGQIRASFADPRETAGAGRLGDRLVINGHDAPEVLRLAPGSRIRLRVLNAANARPFMLKPEGLRLTIIAVDGQPTEPFEPARGVSLLPGNRIDLVLEVPADAGGRGGLLAGPDAPVFAVEADGAPSPLRGSPLVALPMNDLPAAIELQRARRADLVIEGGVDPKAAAADVKIADPARIWTVNGVAWPDASAKPVLTAKAGTPVSLGLINRTAYMQSIHVHGHCVRLLHRLDDGWEPYWLETVPVAPGATARIAFVAESPGRWMIGSSVLERLSSGLAAWFEVS